MILHSYGSPDVFNSWQHSVEWVWLVQDYMEFEAADSHSEGLDSTERAGKEM